MTHRVAVLALPGVVTFDLAAPVQILRHDRHRDGDLSRYDVVTAGLAPRVVTREGHAITVDHGPEALEGADTVVVAGYDDAPFVPPPAAACVALRAAAERGARLVSICVGAFALAHAGLLDGRRATTHWAATDLLAERFRDVRVQSDVLWVDDGDVLTSAGLASGLDLCLHLVRRDHGARVAAEIARWNVVAPYRDGAQAQFVSLAVPDAHDTTLADVCAWALRHLDRPLELAEMAGRAGLSERSLLRRFRAEIGTSPRQWLLRARLDRARELLESSDRPVEVVARDAGFTTAAALRARFTAVLGTTPTAYRRSFARRDAPPTPAPGENGSPDRAPGG